MERIHRTDHSLVVTGPKGIKAEFSASGSPWPNIPNSPFTREWGHFDFEIDLAGENELAVVHVTNTPAAMTIQAIAMVEQEAILGDVTLISLDSANVGTLFSVAPQGADTISIRPPGQIGGREATDTLELILNDACTSGVLRVVVVFEKLMPKELIY